jgi:vacuolar-type H+-ATPase subunit H
MEVDRVISISEKLQELLKNAEKEADDIVARAHEQAERMVSEAKVEAEKKIQLARLGQGIDEYLREEEEKVTREAEKILKEFRDRSETSKQTAGERLQQAVELIVNEVVAG